MKFFDAVELFADTDEFDGFARDSLDGQGGPAAGIAVELGHDHAVDAESFIEGRSRRNGILTGHGVDDQEDFMRMNIFFNVNQFIHQGFVDMKAPGRIDDDDVAQMAGRIGNGVLGDGDRVLAAFFGVNGHIQFLTEDLQLGDSRRAIDVGCYHERALALRLQLFGELGCRRRLTSPLETDQHDDGRRFRCNGNAALGPAEEFRQFIADDFDDRLRRIQAAEDFFTDGFFFDFLDKVFGDGKVDVRFE